MFGISKKMFCLVSFLLVLGAGALVANAEDILINFQLMGGDVPEDYLPDYGEAFGDRGDGWSYGWSRDIQADARNRDNGNAPDERYDTVIHLQKGADAVWEIELPNGTYEVLVVGGDPGYTDQTNNFDVEGILLEDEDPQMGAGGFDFDEYEVTVVVEDGRLTLKPGVGSANSKILFIDIKSATSPVSPSGSLSTTWGGIKAQH